MAVPVKVQELAGSEQVKPIPGFPAYFITESGRAISTKPHNGSSIRFLSIAVSNAGYQFISPVKPNGEGYILYIHKLVAVVFIGKAPFRGAVVRHLDGNKTNNHISNLMWGTYSDNYADAIQHNTNSKGEINGNSKITEKDVIDIRNRIAKGEKPKLLVGEYGIKYAQIVNIATRKAWAHIEGGASVGEVQSALNLNIKSGAKLTPSDIPAVRTLIAQGRSDTEIAKMYGVSRKAISNIRHNVTWRDC